MKCKIGDALSKRLRNGMRIFIGSGCAVPQALLAELMQKSSDLADVEIIHIRTEGEAPYVQHDQAHHFRHNAWEIGPNTQAAVNSGLADFTPLNLSEIPEMLFNKAFHIDLALISVSPPDSHGYCSLGVSVDVIPAVLANASCVIAEINSRMPRTLGETFIRKTSFDAWVETDTPLLSYEEPSISQEADDIGRLVSDLIEDGATLHLGLSPISMGLLKNLAGKKDLGIHTHAFTSSLIPLIEKGVVNGRKKSMYPGKVVASCCKGTPSLYNYVHDNPAFEFLPTEKVSHPSQIKLNSSMVSLQSAEQIDLTGQSTIGNDKSILHSTNTDFLRGSAISPGGKPIIALPSLRSDGTSAIVASLAQGPGILATRTDVHYIVTEYGIAQLHGKTMRERALALIHIAHPNHRETLLESARKSGLVHPQQISIPKGLRPYPREYETKHKLKNGRDVFFRPIKPTDEDMLKELFYSHSEETILQRYFTVFKQLPFHQLQRFVTLDYKNDMAIVGLVPFEGREKIICVGRYFRDENKDCAEAAFTVHDEWQGKGLCSFLLPYLAQIARENGISGFKASVLANNVPMLHLFRSFAPHLSSKMEEGVLQLRFDFNDSSVKSATAPGKSRKLPKKRTTSKQKRSF